MPEFEGFCGASYRLETPNAAPDRSINFYRETIEKGARAGKKRLRGIPGLKLFKALDGPLRALWSNATTCFAIAGGKMYQIFEDATPSLLLGVLANDPRQATIVSNGFSLAMSSGGKAYVAPGGGAGVIEIQDIYGQPVNASSIAFLNQFYLVALKNSKTVMVSAVAPAATWDPGDVSIKEAYSDNIVKLWVDSPGGQYVWLFGDDTTEIWAGSANLFPFERIQSGVLSIGCDSADSVAGAAGNRFWLWRGAVYWASGFQPQIISDFGIEEIIRSYSKEEQSAAEGMSWVDGSHLYFALSFSDRTLVFDLREKEWHERLYFSNGLYGRYRPRVYTRAFGKHLVGDYETGEIYEMDPRTYTDARGVPLRSEKISSYLTDGLNNVRYNNLRVDMDTGIGLDVARGRPGYDPQGILKYSWNRGKNWSDEITTSLGKIGETETRVVYPNLGSSRIGMTFSFVITDPVPRSINTAYLDINPGNYHRK